MAIEYLSTNLLVEASCGSEHGDQTSLFRAPPDPEG